MLNIISFLLLILADLICIKSADMPNQLLNLGVLVISGYLFAILARYLKIPRVFGYIIAGVIISPKGFGLLSTGIAVDSTIIENILLMFLISETVRLATQSLSLKTILRSTGKGVFGGILTFVFTFFIFVLTGLSAPVSLLYSLFTATFAPVLFASVNATNKNNSRNTTYHIGAFGGVFIVWCITAAYVDPELVERFRTALSPVMIALTSLVSGIVWGFLTEFAFYQQNKTQYPFLAIIGLFLLYPLLQPFGFDSIFIGAGYGCYTGMLSNHKYPSTPDTFTALSTLIVFTLFGTRLSLEDAVTVIIGSWQTVGIVFLALIIGRLLTYMVMNRMLNRIDTDSHELSLSILTGPLALLMVHRFGPAFSYSTLSANETPFDLMVITTTMLLIATFAPLFHLFYQKLLPLNTSEAIDSK